MKSDRVDRVKFSSRMKPTDKAGRVPAAPSHCGDGTGRWSSTFAWENSVKSPPALRQPRPTKGILVAMIVMN